MKKQWIAALTALMLAGLCACAVEQPGVPPNQEEVGAPATPSPSPKIITPSKFGAAVNAPVRYPVRIYAEWEHAALSYDSETWEFSAASLGLTDKAVERKIMGAISKKLDELRRYYPKRRITVTYSPDIVPYEHPTGGFLSLGLTARNEDTGAANQTGLNFDLRTGELFDLRAIFADNVDAELELNRYLSLLLLSREHEARRFKGIDMSTPFLVDAMREILFLFPNEKTPPFAGETLTIPFYQFGNNGDVVAVLNRFLALPREAWESVRDDDAPLDTALRDYYGSDPDRRLEELTHEEIERRNAENPF